MLYLRMQMDAYSAFMGYSHEITTQIQAVIQR